MRIGVLVPSLTPNSLYRAIMPMEALARRGHTVGTAVQSETYEPPPLEAFLSFDVVYFWQVHHEPVRRIAKALRERGIAVIWDSDDDLTAVPKEAQGYRDFAGVRGQRMWAGIQRMIRLSDAVTTPSRVLADLYASVGQEHVHVVENYIPNVNRRRATRGSEVVVGWVAQSEHGVDVRALDLRAVLARVLELRPNVRVQTVGVALGLESERYGRTEPVQLADLMPHVGRFDIGIAPLADIKFNRSRSNLKVKEYAAQGVPWLASSIGPYAGLGEAQGGRLVDADRWVEEIVALADDAKARKKLASRAIAWAETQTIAANVGEWERVIEAAVGRARARGTVRV